MGWDGEGMLIVHEQAAEIGDRPDPVACRASVQRLSEARFLAAMDGLLAAERVLAGAA